MLWDSMRASPAPCRIPRGWNMLDPLFWELRAGAGTPELLPSPWSSVPIPQLAGRGTDGVREGRGSGLPVMPSALCHRGSWLGSEAGGCALSLLGPWPQAEALAAFKMQFCVPQPGCGLAAPQSWLRG